MTTEGVPVEGYAVSAEGQVWSFWKPGPGGGLREQGLACRTMTDADGFAWLKLRTGHGQRSAFFVHRLVAAAFVPRTDGEHTDVVHLNHNHGDNRAANLAWMNKADAFAHSALVSNRYTGSQGGRPTLTPEKAEKVRRSGATNASLAERYNVTERAIRNVRAGKSWDRGRP